MDWKKWIPVGLAIGVLMVAMASMAVVPASAWSQGSYKGHTMVVSDSRDIPSDLKLYIKKVEYDAVCEPKMGARLYLTTRGCWYGLWYNNANKMAKFVVEDTGYWAGDRNTESVAYEIRFHCRSFWTDPIHIEYNYADLRRNNPPNIVF